MSYLYFVFLCFLAEPCRSLAGTAPCSEVLLPFAEISHWKSRAAHGVDQHVHLLFIFEIAPHGSRWFESFRSCPWQDASSPAPQRAAPAAGVRKSSWCAFQDAGWPLPPWPQGGLHKTQRTAGCPTSGQLLFGKFLVLFVCVQIWRGDGTVGREAPALRIRLCIRK